MVKVTVLYGHPSDPSAFESYYGDAHMRLVAKVNLPRTEAARVVATPDGSQPAYYRSFDIWFDDMQQMQQALSSPEGQAMAGDMPNFATGGVTVLISEVE